MSDVLKQSPLPYEWRKIARNSFFASTVILAALGITGLPGCKEKTTVEGGSRDGIHVEASGVKINIGEGKGVRVEAPYTKVNVDGNGIQVEAPNTKVNVGGGNGVQVEAPNTRVNVGGEKK